VVTLRGRSPQDVAVLLLRKVLSSLGVVAAAVGLMGFATLGSFDDARDPFPQSVPAPQE
jgi:hypothetical protein